MYSKVDTIAHRGASGSHPENTLAAYVKAVELGADRIELDVQCTRDHEVVTIHDATVDRTTDGTGYVRDFTLPEIKTLDAGNWFSPVFQHERVPTLNEIMATLKPTSVQLCIEIKGQNATEAQAIVSRTIEVIEAHEMLERCVITSFIPAALSQTKRRQPLLVTALDPNADVAFTARELCTQVMDVGGDILLQRYTWLSRQLVDDVHTQGIPIWAWTVNEVQAMHMMLSLSIDGIMTDHPDRLHRLLSSPMP
ncbi:hypothetical protein C2W62_17030 [Candidatus Entotheonella serta]|nr:hypothetical protein C2W62_17030 [Candidatus Entotheonella serta]